MASIFPDPSLVAAFVAASLVLALTPGPAVLYIVARCMSQGRRSGFASVAGVALGNLGNAVAAALGLAAVFAVSSTAFTVVKWAGALYLVWLGVQALRRGAAAEAPALRRERLGRVFRDGFLVALLNPKTTLFFAAFLPQFIAPAGSTALQSVALGALFVAVAATTDLAYVLASSLIAPAFAQARGAARVGRYASAGTYIGLGVFTAFTDTRK